jgi:hypothetical protein
MRILLAGILGGIVMFIWPADFLSLFEIAGVLERFDHLASVIVNADHSIM